METLGHVHAYRCMCTHAQALRMHVYTYTSMRMHAKVPETMRNKCGDLSARMELFITRRSVRWVSV